MVLAILGLCTAILQYTLLVAFFAAGNALLMTQKSVDRIMDSSFLASWDSLPLIT